MLARNILLLGALDEIGAAAGKNGLKFILLKGAALLAQGFSTPGGRAMTDLDLLVRPADEKAFGALLSGLGFRPMENSSQAWCRMPAAAAPPVIADLHTGLWHQKDAAALWARARILPSGSRVPGFGDQLLHLASHGLLYHGAIKAGTMEDLAALLAPAYAGEGRSGFWAGTAAIAAENGLKPVVYPVFRRFAALRPELMDAAELAVFAPGGRDKIKRLCFEKAAADPSRPLEYFLPVLYRPELFLEYMFPGGSFLERRYGKASPGTRLLRPFRLLASAFFRFGR